MVTLSAVTRFVATAAVLLGVWLLLSGRLDALHLGLGVAGALAITAAFYPWHNGPGFPVLRFLVFVPWALGQIVISNWRVAKLVLAIRAPKIRPKFIRRGPGIVGDRPLTTLGCAITLTPGTLTVEIDDDHMLVHALDKPSAQDIEEEVMAGRVARVFGDEAAPPAERGAERRGGGR